MTDLHKAAQQVLDALELAATYGSLIGPQSVIDAHEAAITALREALAAPAVPNGYALVPKKMTPAMRDVTDQDDWDWPDLLAAAESITMREYHDLLVDAASQAKDKP